MCTLLKYAHSLGLIEKIYDEAHYYETEDITVLLDNKEESLKGIVSLTKILQGKFGAENIVGHALKSEEMLKEYDIGQNK